MNNSLREIWSNTLRLPAVALAITPNGELLAVGCSFDRESGSIGSLILYETRTGQVVRHTEDDWHLRDVCASPDNQWLAVAEHRSRRDFDHPDEWRTRIVSVKSGAERCRYQGKVRMYHTVFAPNGTAVAAIGEGAILSDNPFHVVSFDAVTGTERWELAFDSAVSVACSPDSRSIVVGFSGGAAVFDAATGQFRFRVAPGTPVRAVAYSPDNQWLVCGTGEGFVDVVDATSGQPHWSVRLTAADLDPNFQGVFSVAVSVDSQSVAAVGGDVACVYDLLTGQPRFQPQRTASGVAVRFSPNLRHVAVNVQSISGVEDVTYNLAIIDAHTGRECGHSDRQQIWGLDYAIDGNSIAVCGGVGSRGVVRLYDLVIETSSFPVDAAITGIEMSPAGPALVAVADDNPAVTAIDAATGNRLARKPIPGTLGGLAFADQGQAIAVCGSLGVRLFSIVGARFWKDETIGTVNALAVGGPAGEWVAAASGRTARVLSTADGHNRWHDPNTHPQTVTRLAMSGDGRWVATGCADRRVRILDATTGTEVFAVGADGKIFDLKFGPLGILLATANDDGSVVIVDTGTVSVRSTVTRPIACSLLGFNRDETLLAAAWDDNTVSIFDSTATGAPVELRRLTYPNPVTALAFDPAGTAVCLATGSPTVFVVDPYSGNDIVVLRHPQPVRHIAFSSDGTLVATACDDRVVRVFEPGTGRPA